MGRAVQTAIDSLNFFVESRNAGQVISVVTTGTGSFTSADQFNTAQKGAMFFVTIASVTVSSVNVQFSMNAKDVVTGTYYPYITASLALTGATPQGMILMYVGASSLTFAQPGVQALINLPLPNVFQLVTSLSIGNTSGSGTLSYSVDYSKVM
jgi:hypothetical protein